MASPTPQQVLEISISIKKIIKEPNWMEKEEYVDILQSYLDRLVLVHGSNELLITTEIGKVVRKLKKHKNNNIKGYSSAIIKRWMKEVIKEEKINNKSKDKEIVKEDEINTRDNHEKVELKEEETKKIDDREERLMKAKERLRSKYAEERAKKDNKTIKILNQAPIKTINSLKKGKSGKKSNKNLKYKEDRVQNGTLPLQSFNISRIQKTNLKMQQQYQEKNMKEKQVSQKLSHHNQIKVHNSHYIHNNNPLGNMNKGYNDPFISNKSTLNDTIRANKLNELNKNKFVTNTKNGVENQSSNNHKQGSVHTNSQNAEKNSNSKDISIEEYIKKKQEGKMMELPTDPTKRREILSRMYTKKDNDNINHNKQNDTYSNKKKLNSILNLNSNSSTLIHKKNSINKEKYIGLYDANTDPRKMKNNIKYENKLNNSSIHGNQNKSGIHPIQEWLSDLLSDMSQYTNVFIENGFDSLALLTTIEEKDLKSMIHKKGHERLIWESIKSLKNKMNGLSNNKNRENNHLNIPKSHPTKLNKHLIQKKRKNRSFNDDIDDEYNSDDKEFLASEDELENYVPGVITSMFKKNLKRNYDSINDNDSSDMEASYEQIQFEEERSKKIAKMEDDKEKRRLEIYANEKKRRKKLIT